MAIRRGLQSGVGVNRSKGIGSCSPISVLVFFFTFVAFSFLFVGRGLFTSGKFPWNLILKFCHGFFCYPLLLKFIDFDEWRILKSGVQFVECRRRIGICLCFRNYKWLCVTWNSKSSWNLIVNCERESLKFNG